jgi:putative colanic acid biosynthesis acetyltransferase WcaF
MPDTPHNPVPAASPWGLRRNIQRVLWILMGRALFASTPMPVRRLILRAFGASIDSSAFLHRTVRIEIPWTLTLGPGVRVGEHAVLYALGPITLGAHTTIAPYAHLCAGTHDFSTRLFDLVRPPITIGPRCTVGVDAYIGPGVTMAEGSTLSPRATLVKDTQPGTVYAGNPAKAVTT